MNWIWIKYEPARHLVVCRNLKRPRINLEIFAPEILILSRPFRNATQAQMVLKAVPFDAGNVFVEGGLQEGLLALTTKYTKTIKTDHAGNPIPIPGWQIEQFKAAIGGWNDLVRARYAKNRKPTREERQKFVRATEEVWEMVKARQFGPETEEKAA